jgi:HEAT repeat protein
MTAFLRWLVLSTPIRIRSGMTGMSLVGLAFVLSITAAALGQSGATLDGKSPRDLVAALRSDDPKARDAAWTAFYRLGPKAKKDAVPFLISALDDPKTEVQKAAVELLGTIGPEAAAAAPKLASKLGDNWFLYNTHPVGQGHSAAWTLGAIGAPAVPPLIDALESNSSMVRRRAASTLGEIGPAAKDAVPALVRLIKKYGAPKGAGAEAVQTLGNIGPAAAEAIPTLHAAYDALKDSEDDESIRFALSEIGGPPSPGLIQRLDATDPQRRVRAAALLGQFFGPLARAAAPRLEAALNDQDSFVRVSMAACLAKVDPANRRALWTLIASLDSTDLEVLEPAISAISELGTKGAAAVAKLKAIVGRNDLTHKTYGGEMLEATIEAIKISAAEALVAVSPGSGEGVSAYLALLKQGDDHVKTAALERLGPLGPKAAVPALAAIARDAASVHRYEAVKALSQIDPQHETILPVSIGLLVDPGPRSLDPDEKGEIITYLGVMGQKALPAIPALVRVLKDVETKGAFGGRDAFGPAAKAARALGRIGPAAKDAIPALVEAMKTEDSVGMAAGKALASLGTAARPVISDLLPLLKRNRISPWAARVLGAIGPEARAAVPALIEALNGRETTSAAAFGSALLRIEPSQRAVVEARLATIPHAWLYRYSRTMLSAVLGRRSPEADKLALERVQGLNKGLATWDEAVANSYKTSGYALGMLDATEDSFDELAELGPGAAEAVPRLTELAHHAEPLIQRWAAAALDRIDSK